jgi:hypothetical protein
MKPDLRHLNFDPVRALLRRRHGSIEIHPWEPPMQSDREMAFASFLLGPIFAVGLGIMATNPRLSLDAHAILVALSLILITIGFCSSTIALAIIHAHEARAHSETAR